MNDSKCREALNNLKNVIITRKYDKELTKEYVKVLDDLITEHFNNPPLKFEELKEGMWVWDNKRKEWCKFLCWCVFEYLDGYDDKFEENRFYRKQVEEC